MLSRVADSLFWMARYMERTDGILRMLKTNYALSQDDLQYFSWLPVLKIFAWLPEKDAEVIARQGRTVLQYMVTDRENPNSVFNIVTMARENARSVQDHIPKELWQVLNDLYHTVRDEQLLEWLYKEDPVTALDVLIKQGLLFYGTSDISMARGEGYSFMNIGRFLERAIQSADILDVKFSDTNYDFSNTTDTSYWRYLLMSISGYELYLKNNRSGFEAERVVEQIVLNDQFPRSVIYSINQVSRYFEKLKNQQALPAYNNIDFMIGKVNSRVRYSTPQSIMQQGLHIFLTEIKNELHTIGNALNQQYFAYS
ncbi:MAG: alpha-E domain-containing protein [Candidatus Pseudobacter hemicellulosilyticus]|uniref:Alpha-E domain-containing protein n=1 Tax=Candidatus Pseudobacter hemicellulosilyticus TaxID=3121375 RepID=A0AAJ5X0N9_9BACT|nr:MAG: alpha-E domain-containing protein [Pseudobacter sp.]